MKKIVLTFVAIFMAVMGMAQTPSVAISYDEISAFEITASYDKAESCTNYYIFSGDEGEIEQWLPMMGSIENTVKAWGVACVNDTTKVWDQLTPNTTRIQYVVAVAADGSEVLITDTTKTATWGGEGESVITIAISEVTDNSARVVCTPNDQTAEFHTTLIEKPLFEIWGLDSVVNFVKGDPYPQYVEDDHVWSNIVSGTDYKVLAIGKNVNGEWGEAVVDSFSTTGERPAPSVAIKLDPTSLSATSFKVDFKKNESCITYGLYADTIGGLDFWKQTMPWFAGLSDTELALQFSKRCQFDTTYIWNELIPNTTYVVYAVALDYNDTVMYTDTIRTAVLGGEGLSTIEVAVSEITDSTARVICTPNDQTAAFHTVLIPAAMYEEWGQDSVLTFIKEDPYTQYEVDDHVWTGLEPNTAYKVIALGMNVNDEWGELAVVDFITTGGSEGIEDVEVAEVMVYPNPTTSYVKVMNVEEGSVINVYDLQGRKMIATKAHGIEMMIDMSSLNEGIYLLQVSTDNGIVGKGVRIIKK